MGTVLGGLLILFGIITLVKGELRFSRSRISRGTPARIAGILLILALPIAILAGAIAPVVMELSGHPPDVHNPPIDMLALPLVIIPAVVVVALFVSFKGVRAQPESENATQGGDASADHTQSMNIMEKCPHCGTRVLFITDICPSCNADRKKGRV